MSTAANSTILWTTSYAPSCTFVDNRRSSIRSNIALSRCWTDREAELLAIRRYESNWDGFDADAPDPAIVDTALAFLRVLRDRDESNPPGRVILSPDGLVAIEWQKDESFVRAEVVSVEEIEWMRVSPGEPTQFDTERLEVPSSPVQTWEHAWEQRPSNAAGEAVSG
jgi:hypothetical protein